MYKRNSNVKIWGFMAIVIIYTVYTRTPTSVPVLEALISPNSKVITASENSTISLQCTTSECRPEPKFTWYKDNSKETDGDEEILSQTGVVVSFATVIQTYTSYFNTKLTRDLNGWYIFCSAANYIGGSVPSDKIMLNVTYPPDRPPRIGNLLDGSEVKSIQGENVDLECSITGDPPGRPEIWLLNSPGTNIRVNKTLHVIEGRAVTLNCSAKSNPPVSLYKWNELIPKNSFMFKFENHDRNTNSISCHVSNEMRTSDSRPTVTGTNVTHLAVNVLYPPTVYKMTERTVVRGDDVIYSCNFVPGNPSVTNVTWSWNGTTWNDRLLTIANVSMNHTGVYRCDVQNLMVSSDGTEELGKASGEFRLFVETYKNDKYSTHSSNVSVVAASVAGTVAGVVFLAALITILVFYRRRKRLPYQKKDDSIQYYNCNDSKVNENPCISTKVDNANAYEAFQHAGSDRQYDTLSPEDCKTEKKTDCQISAEGGNVHVYEELQSKGFDQQYDTISPSASNVNKEHHKVYENLQ